MTFEEKETYLAHSSGDWRVPSDDALLAGTGHRMTRDREHMSSRLLVSLSLLVKCQD